MAAPELVESKDEEGFTPLHLAVIAGNIPLVTFLLANNADVTAVDNEKHTVVHWATVCGETEALRAVIAAGAPISTPDVHRGYPLHYAAQMCGGHERDASLGFQVLQTLLTTSGIDVKVEDGDGRQPLLWAASAGSAKAILALIRAGSPVEAADKDGLTALHCAASRGHTDCIDTLLTLCGASCDIIDSNGCTALHYAVTLGHADATALLLAHGSDPNRQDRKGRSPAHCGCSKGQFETVKMLASHGANLWLKNARGDLPLHEAAASGRRDLVKWLLAMRPSQVNARNNDGRCPLHLAALNDNADMCKILLDSGAQVNPILRTSKNVFMTPLDCALRRGFRSTAKYLQLHGGVPASRLHNSQQQNVNSAVSMHIRDDITFWGDTSTDSERENGELNKHLMKLEKKKMAQKFKRKRGSASSELENRVSAKSDRHRSSRKHSDRSRVRNDSASSAAPLPRKSSRSRFDYSNEIVINGNTEINIHQSRAISVGKDIEDVPINHQIHEKIITSKPLKSSSTGPKSAKHGYKIKTYKSDSDRSSATKSSASTSSRKLETQKKKTPHLEHKDQATNTTEQMKDAASSVHVTKSDASVITDDHLIQSLQDHEDKANFTSSRMSDTSEDQERQQNIVVEASIHEPPKDFDISNEEPPLLVSSDKPEDDNILEQESGISVEETIKKETVVGVERNNDETQEIQESKGDESLEMKNEKTENELVSNQEVIIEEDNPPTEQPDNSKTGDEKDENIDERDEIKTDNQMENDNNEADEEINDDKTTENGEDAAGAEDLEIESEKKKKLSNLKRILSHDTFLRNQAPSEETTELNEIAKEVANAAISMISLNIEQELSLKINGEDQDIDKSDAQDDVSSNTEIMNTGDTTVRQLSEDKTNLHADKTGEEENEQGEEDIMQKAFGETVSEESPADNSPAKGFREGKRPKDSLAKTPTPTEESSTSSVSENRQHKSFTVLDDKEVEEAKTKRKTGKLKFKKQRSKSEENEKETKNIPHGRPSKIPTPLGKSLLSKSEKHLNRIGKNTELSGKVPSLPDINNLRNRIDEPYRSRSTISTGRRVAIYSDEKGTGSEDEEIERLPSRRRRIKRRSHRRDSRSAGSDYESSNVIDSGFEPSPRSVRVPKWRNMSERGVNMTSVTQSIQSNIRRYHLERKIFQHLLELKRLQIRSGQHNEATLVKRAIDAYHSSCASTVGAGRYVSKDLSFRAFEKFLYDSLRKLQKNDSEYLRGLPEAPNNPLFCTRGTHRCMHATHAYTGVPCAAYLPKLDHHSIPKIGFNDCKPGTGGFLPSINPKKSVTLELCHGNDKQIISLPADRLDQNKRYYVTFTVKGTENDGVAEDTNLPVSAHRHSRSD